MGTIMIWCGLVRQIEKSEKFKVISSVAQCKHDVSAQYSAVLNGKGNRTDINGSVLSST